MNTPGKFPTQLEPFCSAEVAAEFMGINRRYLLQLAREGLAGAYALGSGLRKTWVFRLSELSGAVGPRGVSSIDLARYDRSGSPR